MRRHTHLFILVPLALLALAVGVATAGAGSARAPAPADTVYTNGVIYTVDATRSTAQAIAVRDGKIIYVGTDAGAADYVGPGTTQVNLKGRFMMPGFIDAHMHASTATGDIYEVYLYGLPTMKAYQRAIKRFVAAHPELTVIQGSGWANTVVPGIGPTRRQLDACVKNIPAIMYSEDGHSAWVNSKALKMAGITAKTKNPKGGVIERYPGTRIPSGTLREAAVDLVAGLIPGYSVDQEKAGILHFERDVAGPLGMTTVSDASLDAGGTTCAAYEQLAQAGQLTVRVRGAIHVDPTAGPIDTQIAAAEAERSKHHTDLFQTNETKFFVDGVVEGHTALINYPYKDRPGYLGVPVWPSSRALQDASVAAAKAGFQLHYHAIGDAAVSEALNAIGAAEIAVSRTDIRAKVTHLQMVTPTDFTRFAQLGVVALPQPYWFVKDSYYYNLQLPYLGKWRADREYPMKSFFDNGVLVASSSDYNVTYPPDPLDAIQTGVMRWFQGSYEWAKKGDILWPAERVTRRQMIDSFTINGAKSFFLEDETGSLEVGKYADMIVLDRNILTCPVAKIGDGKVLLTVFQGNEVYKDAKTSL
jgi:predicted amidohydrolase YtcJ